MSLRNILSLFLFASSFEAGYSYKWYSNKEKTVHLRRAWASPLNTKNPLDLGSRNPQDFHPRRGLNNKDLKTFVGLSDFFSFHREKPIICGIFGNKLRMQDVLFTYFEQIVGFCTLVTSYQIGI